MIAALRELRDWLDAIEHDGEDYDQGAMDAAVAIVERLIVDHEPPLPTPKAGLCYRVKTPVSRATAPPPPRPPQPQKPRHPKSQPFETRRKRA